MVTEPLLPNKTLGLGWGQGTITCHSGWEGLGHSWVKGKKSRK